MQTLKFSIHIDATAEKVWNCLWESENYQQWKGVLSVGSYYNTEQFSEGQKIQLLTPTGGGMYSIVETIDPCKLLVLNHIGEIKDFQELPASQETQWWTNAKESYELTNSATGIELKVQLTTLDTYVEFIKNSFPLALQVVKKIAEGNDN